MSTYQDQSFGIIPIYKSEVGYQVCIVYHAHTRFWGLPKGHLEEGETPHDCAKRELFEETGLTVSEIDVSKIFIESYTFELEGKRISKRVTFFLGRVLSQKLAVDGDEISTARWLHLDEAIDTLTYRESQNILKEVIAYLEASDSIC